MVTPLRTIEIGAVAAAVALSAILFLPAAADPVNPVKLAVVALAALVCAAAAAADTIRSRELRLPGGAPIAGLGAFVVALLAATLASPSTTTAVLGAPGRLSGLLVYATAALLAVSTLRSGSAGLPWIHTAVVAGGTFTAVYGLLQFFGLDAVRWANQFNPILGSLGNPNFASGLLGICTPVAVGWALRLRRKGPAQVSLLLLALLMFLTAAMSESIQGPLAAVAGLGVVALAFGLTLPTRARRLLLSALTVLGAAGVSLLGGGLKGLGPASGVFGAGNFTTRRWYWDAALTMWSDQPVLGVGIDHYGMFWRTARPLENIVALGGGDFSDAAHSVPLHLLATGGLVVGLAYLLFVTLVLMTLVRGLLRGDAHTRLRLAGVGGGWVAYQVQSLVSIDQVPLVVLNVVLAAAVVVAAGGIGLREWRLPGALEPPPPPKPGRRQAVSLTRRVRVQTPTDAVLLALVIGLGLILSWQILKPLRADVQMRTGEIALLQGNGNAALSAFERATRLAPGRSPYWSRYADVLKIAQKPEAALAAYDRALAADPSNMAVLSVAAAMAEEKGDDDRARRYHEQAVDQDPFSPVTLAAAANFELRRSGAQRAREILEPAVLRTPTLAPLWTPLGDARQVLGDRAGAIDAYRRALDLDPSIAKATAELAKLTGAAPG